MIKKIIKDEEKLKEIAEIATIDDLYIVEDLIDTLKKNKDVCVGMAANMIGYNKSIIVVYNNDKILPMINPKIITKRNAYRTEESCLSLTGLRTCIRHEDIEVEYYDINMNKITNKFNGFTAEIIEHEIDHLSGIII